MSICALNRKPLILYLLARVYKDLSYKILAIFTDTKGIEEKIESFIINTDIAITSDCSSMNVNI